MSTPIDSFPSESDPPGRDQFEISSNEYRPVPLVRHVPLLELSAFRGAHSNKGEPTTSQATGQADPSFGTEEEDVSGIKRMNSPLRILHLEDNPNDAKLVRAVLETEGIACATTCVRTQDAFVAALERGAIDLVPSDFSMPGFDGLAATKIVHARWPSIPFIFVSGTLGEERGAEALKSGATDYVLKEDLVRLAPAVRLAMEESDEEPGVIPQVSSAHNLAMDALPVDGRWRTEAQVVAQSKLGNRAGGIFRDLVRAGYCEERIVPILCHVTDAEDFMRMYRTTWKRRRAYGKRFA
jgi:CheY-like chemotaxis protein